MPDKEKYGKPEPWIDYLTKTGASYDAIRSSVTNEEFAEYLEKHRKLPKANQVEKPESETLKKEDISKEK